MSIKERLKEFAKYKGISIATLEKSANLSNGYVNSIRKSISEDKLEQISNAYPEVNTIWLKMNVGNMLIDDTETDEKGLPLIPLDAMAGFGNGEVQIHKSQITDYYEVPLFENRGAKYLIPVAGNSMYPKYASGDLLACKPLSGLNFVQWGKPYVLDTEQGAIVKRLFQHPENEEMLICKSDNVEFYPPFYICKKEIYNIAIVVGVIRLE